MVFYIVVGREWAKNPHRHENLEAAREEAIRLARKTGLPFTVFACSPLLKAELVDVQITKLASEYHFPPEDGDIPF